MVKPRAGTLPSSSTDYSEKSVLADVLNLNRSAITSDKWHRESTLIELVPIARGERVAKVEERQEEEVVVEEPVSEVSATTLIIFYLFPHLGSLGMSPSSLGSASSGDCKLLATGSHAWRRPSECASRSARRSVMSKPSVPV